MTKITRLNAFHDHIVTVVDEHKVDMEIALEILAGMITELLKENSHDYNGDLMKFAKYFEKKALEK